MKKFFNSFLYAFNGIRTAVVEQRNLRIHLVATTIVVAAGFHFDVSGFEWAILLLTCSLVIGLEMINTALEYLTDLASPNIHPLAKKVKDVAAGAVLIAAIFAVVIAVLIFRSYF